MKIGILSLQGGVVEHIHHVEALGHEAVEIKKVTDLEGISGLILPGGESTTIGKILRRTNMMESLKEKIEEGLPVWGTCAGMILLAKRIEGSEISHLGAMDITVRRNAYGTQLESFIVEQVIEEVTSEPIPLVFIRAPYIVDLGEQVEIICTVEGHVVAAKQGAMLVSSFHPELTEHLAFHKYFISMCKEN